GARRRSCLSAEARGRSRTACWENSLEQKKNVMCYEQVSPDDDARRGSHRHGDRERMPVGRHLTTQNNGEEQRPWQARQRRSPTVITPRRPISSSTRPPPRSISTSAR